MQASAGTSYDAYMGRNRFGNLDGLRFFCIMAVLWHHSPAFGALDSPTGLVGRGFLGVDYFFVLSGYLITTLLLREEKAKGRFSLTGFYWRRILRIMPVYMLVVTSVSVWFVLIRGQEQYAPLVPFYYLFLANFLTSTIPLLFPLWSLAVEEQYYLIWPFLLRLLPRASVIPILGVVIAANVAVAAGWIGVEAPEIGVLRFALPNATYAPILMGSVLAMLLERPQGFKWLWQIVGHRTAPAWTHALLLVLMAFGPVDLRGLPNFAIHLVMTVCLASLVVREDAIGSTMLRWPPIVRIGEISYGIYLYHLIALHFAMAATDRLQLDGTGGLWLTTGIYVVLSLAVSDVSYRTLEAWFRRLRHKRPGRLLRQKRTS